MSALYQQQQALLDRQLQILGRIEQGIRYSLARLPDALRPDDLKNPDTAERIASLNDRCTKLQDQLAGALRHAHGMLGERSYADVVSWAAQQDIVATPEVWLELRPLRNPTHLLPSPPGRGSQASALAQHTFPQAGGSQTPAFRPRRS